MRIDNAALNLKVQENNNNSDPITDKKLKRATQDFEALFIDNIFKSMRKTIPEGGLIKKTPGDDMYKEMFDTEVALHLAKGKGIGLSGMLYNQLKNSFK